MKASVSSKKRHIINAAADLFQDRGYNATSMRALATKVGLEPSSIYSHINSKEDLLIEICLNCAELFSQGMYQIMNQDLFANTKIKALVELHTDIAYKHPASVTVFNDEWKFLPENTKEIFLSLRKEYEHDFKTILSKGKEQGIFEFDHLDITFNIIMKMLNLSYQATKKYQKPDLNASLANAVLKVLATQNNN